MLPPPGKIFPSLSQSRDTGRVPKCLKHFSRSLLILLASHSSRASSSCLAFQWCFGRARSLQVGVVPAPSSNVLLHSAGVQLMFPTLKVNLDKMLMAPLSGQQENEQVFPHRWSLSSHGAKPPTPHSPSYFSHQTLAAGLIFLDCKQPKIHWATTGA